MAPGPIPAGVDVQVAQVTTTDRARVPGLLYSVPGADTVAALVHPRQDVSRHYLIPILLEAGYSVWAQGTRSVGNDLQLLHEEALLDIAAGISHVRDRGFENVVAVGVSGGAALWAFYQQQASRAGADRLGESPGGRPVPLAEALMDPVDAMAFVAPHAGQGELLLHLIDGSVASESDPLATLDELDIYSEANGFREPPDGSRYAPEFLARYRQAQRDRVARIDALARDLIAERGAAKQRFEHTGSVRDRRRGVFNPAIVVYRTDADPRCVDLSLDPSDRPYGSIHGVRPDIINFGITGFGRITTPEAWLSTWSGLSSNAGFVRCAPDVEVPALFVEYTADQATFPSVARGMFEALGSGDRIHERVIGTHFGGSPDPDGAPGGAVAGAHLVRWLADRFPSS